MNGKESFGHEISFHHHENKRLRKELKMLSSQLDRLIQEKPEIKQIEQVNINESTALLMNLKKKCIIFKREKQSLKAKLDKYNSLDFLENLQISIKKLENRLEKLEKLRKKHKVFKELEKNTETNNPDLEVRSLTYEKYDLIQKIKETEKNLKNLNEKILQTSSKVTSLEQDLKSLKSDNPELLFQVKNLKPLERHSKKRIVTVLNSISSSKILSSKLKFLENELVSLNQTQDKIQENLQERDKAINKFKIQLKVFPDLELFRSASVQPGRLKINPFTRIS